MAAEWWLAEAARAIGARRPCPEDRFPRDLDRLALYGLQLPVVRLPGLTLGLVEAWLRERSLTPPPRGRDRRLRGCLITQPGNRRVFLDSSDAVDEQRYTLAHEMAHLWLEILGPQQRAGTALGPGVVDVLEGRRPPTGAERLQAALHGIPLSPALHLLERDAERGVTHGRILQAEQKADRLAVELLAPEEEALRRITPAGTWSSWMEEATRALVEQFGLPRRIAGRCAARLAVAAGVSPTFRERLAGEHLRYGNVQESR